MGNRSCQTTCNRPRPLKLVRPLSAAQSYRDTPQSPAGYWLRRQQNLQIVCQHAHLYGALIRTTIGINNRKRILAPGQIRNIKVIFLCMKNTAHRPLQHNRVARRSAVKVQPQARQLSASSGDRHIRNLKSIFRIVQHYAAFPHAPAGTHQCKLVRATWHI